MTKLSCFVGLAVMAALLLVAGNGRANTVPEIKRDCSLCHTMDPASGRIKLNMPQKELCVSCHPEKVGKGHHKVGVPPSNEMRRTAKGMPLNRGKVACISCHDVHGFTSARKLLRLPQSSLCGMCHNK